MISTIKFQFAENTSSLLKSRFVGPGGIINEDFIDTIPIDS